MSLIEIIKKVLGLLTIQERKNGALVLLLITIASFLDVLGVASIMPFIAILTSPELIDTNKYISAIYVFFDFKDHNSFLFFWGGATFSLLIISLAIKAVSTLVHMRFSLMREYSIGKMLITRYLAQDYVFYLRRNSLDLGKNILSEVKEIIDKAIVPLMMIFSQGTVAIFLIVLLLIVNPYVAMTVFVVLSATYAVIFFIGRKYLSKIGEARFIANKERYQSVFESFSAIKEIKLSGIEERFSQRFNVSAKEYAKCQSSQQILGQVPRYAIEAIAFGGMIAIILVKMESGEGIEGALPLLSLFAFAGYRLLPALQQIYIAFSNLRFAVPALDSLYSDIDQLKENRALQGGNFIFSGQDISLENISFSYPEAQTLAIDDISLKIPYRSMVGFMGSSGSGKSTVMDIILGLLSPLSGAVKVGKIIINKPNLRDWQNIVGYVPQDIYLSDSSIRENIAFGVPKEEIDQRKVERVAKISHLHSFIVEELSDKYHTIIGERGVCLSGGQRQRIGLARALYNDPSVLILDEATSALDSITEGKIMDSIKELSSSMTIILVAHRLNTLRECDNIYFFSLGKIRNQGSFSTLQDTDPRFIKMLRGR
jgi:ATP-binding cassette, subfamily B, bacterial PglK